MLNQRNGISQKRRPVRALVITPTRELALQIGESFDAYGKNTHLKKAVIFGGVNQNPQTDALRRGVDILIATPGRLLDLMGQGFIHLKHLQIFVLDEADRMLDMGFIHDIKKIIAVLPRERQSLFFSATMPQTIVSLAGSIVRNPVEVSVAPVTSTTDLIKQSVYFVDKANKNNLLLHVLRDKSIVSALVFTRTKYGADKVSRILRKNGIQAEAIHGNKSQSARQKALGLFKEGKIRVLVASDIASRGIDVEELSCVINYEIPNIPETYVHRIGRTGRAGINGIAISFCDPQERAYLKDIQKLIGRIVPVEENHPYLSSDNTAVELSQELKKAPAMRPGKAKSNQGNKKRRNRSWGQQR
jgi:ATP-dependent RNA helicase RhlE